MIAIPTIAGRLAAALGLALVAAAAAQAQNTVGTTLPFTGFDATLTTRQGTPSPWIGFGAAGKASRTPVIFLHGNNGTPYQDTTTCGRDTMRVRDFAQYFVDNGYRLSEVWALGYQGTQCDLNDAPANSAGTDHTVAANVPDLRAFVAKVLASTGASKVDIVAHGMGAILAREWVRQDRARALVRKFVAIEAPFQGMLLCAAVPGNPFALAFSGGYTPSSPVCQELGAPDTPLLAALGGAKDGTRIMRNDTLVIFNGDASFMFRPCPDGLLHACVRTSVDMNGNPTDFSLSPDLKGATELMLTGQGAYDFIGGSAHVGIANSPITWQAALQFLK